MIWVEMIMFEELWSVEEGEKFVHVGDVPGAAVAFQPDVQLS